MVSMLQMARVVKMSAFPADFGPRTATRARDPKTRHRAAANEMARKTMTDCAIDTSPGTVPPRSRQARSTRGARRDARLAPPLERSTP